MSEIQPVNQSVNQSDAPFVKKGRGRPKKVVVETETSSPDTTSESSPETTPAKKPRGRPAKYAPEERQEKYKELCKNWRSDNSDYYATHSEIIKSQNMFNQTRARNALRLLSELMENDQIEVKDEKYKCLLNDLIKNKKIIYT